MLLQEVIAVESDAAKLSAGHSSAKIGNHRILYRSITQIPPVVGGHQSDAGASRQHLLLNLIWNLCDLLALHESLACANHERSPADNHRFSSLSDQTSIIGLAGS